MFDRREESSGRVTLSAAAPTVSLILLAAVGLAPKQARAQDAPSPTLTEELLESIEFRFVGPSNMSGRITALAVPAGDRNKTIYVGMASGGLWKTTNNGTTWSSIFDDQGSSTVGDVAVAPSNSDVVWVGTGERNSLRSNSWGDGVYKSTNAGRSWTHMGLAETQMTGNIVIHPEEENTVYVGALGRLWGANPERGVFKTTDGGETWDNILFVDDTTGVIGLKMDPRDPDVLYAAFWHRLRYGGGRMQGAGAGSGIYKTSDGGATWDRLTDGSHGLPDQGIGRIGLEIAASNPDILYAVVQVARSARGPGVSAMGGVFRSDDAGENWTRVHDVSATPDYYYNEVWIDPEDPERIYLGATRISVSTDGGETFENQRYDNVHVDNHAMWIDPEDPEHIILGNDGGLYISYDRTRTWAHQIIPAAQFYEVTIDTTKVPYHVCGGLQDNGTWCGPNMTRERQGITDADWYAVFGGDGFVSAISPDDPSIRYAESQYGNVSRINTVTNERTGLQPHSEDAGMELGYAFRWDWNTPFIISNHDPTVVYLGGNHLFKMTERGKYWDILGPDMTRGNRFAPEPDSGYTSYRSLHSVAESVLDGDVLWTGSNDGLVWSSSDGGESWTNVTDNMPDQAPTRCWVGEIETSDFDRGTAYVAYDCHRRDDYHPYVFKTTDSGLTWTDITGNLPDGKGSYVVREDYVNPNLLFVGTEQGAWVSITGGNEWVRMDNGLPTAPVRDMEIVRRTGELVVATFGRGMYITDIGALQELAPEVLASPSHLFAVKSTRQYSRTSTYGSFGDQFFRTPNPAYGATIWYYLAENQDDEVKLTIRRMPEDGEGDEAGAERTDGRDESDAGEGGPSDDDETDDDDESGPGGSLRTLTGSDEAGLHKVQWDLTSQKARPRRLGEPQGGGGFGGGGQSPLQRVLPGTYEVTLKVGEETHRQTIVVEDGWVERNPGRMR